MSEPRNISEIRVALVSTGLSHIQRGYETFIQDLYETLHGVANVTLFKGSGYSSPPDIYSVPCLPRTHPWAHRLFPDDENRRYRWEQLSVVFSGWLYGYWQNYDIIHFCDPVFGNAMVRLRKLMNLRYTLLFANCGPSEPEHYQHMDHIQEFTPFYLEKARHIIRKTRLHMQPMGVRTERFQREESPQSLRQKYGLPADKLIILCVASLDEAYKRQSFLIDAVAELNDPELFLYLVGSSRESDNAKAVIAQGQSRLPGQFHYATVPYADIAEVYGASDLFVLPSLNEGFGKVYLEAMAAGLPLLCHDNENTRWIVRDPRSHTDMQHLEALKSAITSMHEGPQLSAVARDMARVNGEWVKEQFHWYALREPYMRMYEQIINLPV